MVPLLDHNMAIFQYVNVVDATPLQFPLNRPLAVENRQFSVALQDNPVIGTGGTHPKHKQAENHDRWFDIFHATDSNLIASDYLGTVPQYFFVGFAEFSFRLAVEQPKISCQSSFRVEININSTASLPVIPG